MPINKPDIRDIQTREKYIKLFDKYEKLLSQNQQAIFKFYFYENLSYSEISEIVVTTRSAVYDTLKKALNKLDKLDTLL